MIGISKEHLATMMEAGYIYIGMQRYKEAKELFEGLCVIAPDSDVPLVAMGNVEFCQGKLKKAISTYQKALKKDPESVFARVYLGEALVFAGKKEEGVELLNSVAHSKGGASDFAQALLDAIEKGFEPEKAPKIKKV